MNQRELLYFRPSEEANSLIPAIQSSGWSVHTATECEEALNIIKEREILVGLSPIYGEIASPNDISWLESERDRMEWIALLDRPPVERRDLPQLIAGHFYDYHTLPVDTSRLLFSLGHAYGMAQVSNLGARSESERFADYEMAGASPVMRALFRNIRKVASVDAPVLITGESGTGKELAARAVHERSTRAAAPFVAVNCGALPSNLIQSELFGHEKGSFTGAAQRKIGFIESAAGGTLFLDEIGDLPLELQINLLRFLQEQTIERVGGTQKIRVDTRIVAATNVNLEKAVEEGRFREDLYYRLHVLTLRLPPLREREGDVELLARFFFDKFSKEKAHSLKGFSQQAIQAMVEHDWPGNVRELINRVRRAMVMSERRLIMPSDLGLNVSSPRRRLVTLEQARAEAEACAIKHTLYQSRNNISRAARNLGVSRVTLYRLMEKHSISA